MSRVTGAGINPSGNSTLAAPRASATKQPKAGAFPFGLIRYRNVGGHDGMRLDRRHFMGVLREAKMIAA
ncbi:hypothetical protein [Luteolibacter luteus]|uniref:Uncharacterized protein n=1 Tax=Luteolibacter luteus TaxID=2728835 RepID=A0A858RIW0_9BACT|nr:hypothetical protein [Luteolibacter luteus]QJE96655.1 hypothetical protein HHL09_12960 [Luteolibacter luteus]